MKKLLLGAMMLLSFGAWAQKKAKVDPTAATKDAALNALNNAYEADKKTALQIWDFAEVGYKEVKSAALHVQHLKEAGFKVETGVADILTAFVATYGSGSPVIGILAEFDALPGLAQTTSPEKNTIAGKIAGHACGHHLFGTASVASGIVIKELIAAGKLKGTIKIYGCPAEEGGSGKVFLVRAGLLNDLDAVIHWHPDVVNAVGTSISLANKSAKFKFYGIASHAAMSPEQGRSALDAVEAGAMHIENEINCCVGLGANPDRDGHVTLDASIMDHQFNCGSVAFLERIKHPISVARKVMENTPHVLLVGNGAQQFALENGFSKEPAQLSESAKNTYREWLKKSEYKPQINIEKNKGNKFAIHNIKSKDYE